MKKRLFRHPLSAALLAVVGFYLGLTTMGPLGAQEQTRTQGIRYVATAPASGLFPGEVIVVYSDGGDPQLQFWNQNDNEWEELGGDDARLLVGDGAVGSPSIAWASDPDTGLYKDGVSVSFAVGGVRYVQFLGGQASVTGGTVGLPGLGFIGDTDTGMYRPAANGLGFSAGGADLGQWYTASGSLTATQVRKLNATPVEVIAAPGAGLAIIVESARLFLDYGGTAYDSVGNGEDIVIRGASSTSIQAECDETNCLAGDATGDNYGYMSNGSNQAFGVGFAANEAIELTILSAEWATTDDDTDGNSPIFYHIRYRIVTAALS